MKLLLASLISPALATPVVITGSECSEYFVVGVNGYKDVMAHNDPDDPSDMGKYGQKADDTLWTANPNLTTYADASAKVCRTRYGPCEFKATDPIEMTHSYMTVQTCATIRFSFASDSGSTVWKMPDLAAFEGCVFTNAEQIVTGGDLTTGHKFIEFPIDNDDVDKQFYFASQTGCTEGQKVAVTVIETMKESYEDGLKDGKKTARIQHCDCDHSVNPDAAGSEAYHMGFVEGCKSEMPDDLSCCPGNDVECGSNRYGPGCANVKYSNPYKNGGMCYRKSMEKYFIGVAKEVYTKCTDAANKAECDDWKLGYNCPWYRTYNMGGWVFNTDKDGLSTCAAKGECTGDPDPAYPHVPSVCSTSYGCQECAPIIPRYHGRCNGHCAKTLDIPVNYQCDGANTTYTPHCDMWYMVSHCSNLGSDGTLPESYTAGWASDADAKSMIERDISADKCSMERYIHAYNTYSGDTKKWDDWLAGVGTTAAPTEDPKADDSFTVPAAIGLMLAVLAWK